ncbi:MAG: VOC family protein [Clostridia bacterium]|nr:VOC family protein [Clostridia bacterium]
MIESILGVSTPCQIGMITADINRAKKKWAEFLGVEEPEARPCGDYAICKTEYMGEPAPDANSLLAFFDLPNIQLELIEPNAAKSTWRDHLEKCGEGIHHYGYQVKDIFASMEAMKAAGYKLTQFGYYGDASGAYAYFDCTENMGCFIELLCSFPRE